MVDALDRERVVGDVVVDGADQLVDGDVVVDGRGAHRSASCATVRRSAAGQLSRSVLVRLCNQSLTWADVQSTCHRRARRPAASRCSRAEPRIGVLECSRRLAVARGTVQARLDKLIARGVIRGFGPDVAPAAIGFGVTAFVTLEISQRYGHDPVAAHLADDPRGAGGAHHHRHRRPAVPDRGPVQRRPAAGDRPDRRRTRASSGRRRSSRWPSRSRTGRCRWCAAASRIRVITRIDTD